MNEMSYAEPHWRLNGNERLYVSQVLASGFKAGADGAFSTRFERAFSAAYGQEYAIAFNSGTSTLHAALLALGCGPGDEVLVPALTPLMCGLAPHYTGATPVFVDSDYDTFLMDPADLESKITDKTKVILVVHMYGAVCDMDAILEISKRYTIPILEDCAQCHMGTDREGKVAGTFGQIASWSFENSKQLTCGDGGIITTNDESLAERVRKIGGLGFKTLSAKSGKVRTDKDSLQNPDWERFDTIGYNYRMNQLAAAVALAQVEQQDKFISLRVASGSSYSQALEGSSLLTPQKPINQNKNSFYTFSARFEGQAFGISWTDFRKKYMELGGDGIYAASKLLYQEPVFREKSIGWGAAPTSEILQSRLMNFTTNQANKAEIDRQMEILIATREYFGDK